MAILLKGPQRGNAAYPVYARILYTTYTKGLPQLKSLQLVTDSVDGSCLGLLVVLSLKTRLSWLPVLKRAIFEYGT